MRDNDVNPSQATKKTIRGLSIDPRDYDWAEILTQGTALVCLVYATAMMGAIESSIQARVCVLMILPMLILLLRSGSLSFARPKVAVAIAGFWTLWLVFCLLQTIELPTTVLEWVSPTAAQIRSQFGGGGTSVSLIPAMTRNAWPAYVIGLAFFLIGVCAFQTRRSRTTFLFIMTLAGALFACWGLIQRARGSLDVLPGVAPPARALPFSTIAYKNASGSLMLAAFATMLGLVMVMFRSYLRDKTRQLRSGDRSRRSSRQRYGLSAQWIEPHAVATYLMAGVIGLGIVVSLSRGAWIAGIAAMVVTGYMMRHFFFTKRTLIGVALLLIAGAITAQVMGIGDRVLSRASQSNVESLSSNDRLSHWADSAETILQYKILGSGLGTYGHTVLPNQDVDTPRWFKHAHNQPLEWAVEVGAVGLAILLGGIASIAVLLVHLYRDRRDGSTPLIWFVVAAFASISLGIQSLADFVVCTPAVMWTYAIILGVACGAMPDGSKAKAKRERNWDSANSKIKQTLFGRAAGHPAGWMVACLVGLLLSQHWLQQNVVDEELLQATRIPKSLLMPTQEQVTKQRQVLLAQASKNPKNARLWDRLSQWDFAQFRLDLIDASQKEQQPLTWEQTEPARIFGVLFSVSASERDSIRQGWLEGDISIDALQSALEHNEVAIQHNPLVPQVHLTRAWMAPLLDQNWQEPARNSRTLSASHGDLQFANGLLAYYARDVNTMIDQWRRALKHKPQNLPYIVGLGAQRISPDVLVSQILGDLRANLWISLANESHESPQLAHLQTAFVEAAKNAIRIDDSLPDGSRYYQLATMCNLQRQTQDALEHLRSAVKAEPSNPDFRYQLALTLVRQGDLVAAREEAALGRALKPRQPRWKELISRIDRKLAAAKNAMSAPEISSAAGTSEAKPGSLLIIR